MVNVIQVIILIGTLGLSSVVRAQQNLPLSCLPEATSLQVFEIWNESASTRKNYPLKTLNFERLKDSGVEVSMKYSKERKAFDLSFTFKDSNSISLPFNLYAIMIANSRGKILWKDFTSSCMDPGIGFYPGQTVNLDDLSMELQDKEPYRVMIWGQK